MNKQTTGAAINESLRAYREFCFLRGLDARSDKSVRAYRKAARLDLIIKCSIFSGGAIKKSAATNELKTYLNQ